MLGHEQYGLKIIPRFPELTYKWAFKPFLSSYNARHEKTDLKVFVFVIPKEGLGPVNPSLGMTPTTEYNV